MADISYPYREDRSCSGYFEFTNTMVQYADTGVRGLKHYSPFDQGEWFTSDGTGGAATGYAKALATRVTGNVAAGGAWADITDLSVTFTLSDVRNVEIRFSASYAVTAVSSLDVRIDFDAATNTFDFPIMNQVNGSGGDNTTAWAASVVAVAALSAGTHTIKMRHIGTNATLLGDFANKNIATLVVEYIP